MHTLYVPLPHSRPVLEAVLRQLLSRAGVVAPHRCTDEVLRQAGIEHVLTDEVDKKRCKVQLVRSG